MKSILIIRPSAIGDVVMASPMIRVLRKAYPEAYIAWVAEPLTEELLCHNKDLDEIISWPGARWKQWLRRGRVVAVVHEAGILVSRIRRRRFDLVLDAQGLLKSRVLAWFSGAPGRIGLDSKEPGRFLMTKIVHRGACSERMSSEYYQLMNTLGLSSTPFTPNVAVSPEDIRHSADRIRGAGIDGEYSVICPFTTRPQKHWLNERWAELSIAIKEKLGFPVVILGGPGDVEYGRQIRDLADGRILDLTGATSLGVSTGIIRNASLLVGVDTGLTHLGAAFDLPTIALFGATCPYLFTENVKTVVLYKKRSCSPCRRSPTCHGEYPCMKSIEVEQVFNAAHDLINDAEVQQCTSCT